MEATAFQNAYRDAAERVREAKSDEERDKALEDLAALSNESIDNAPDSIQALREAAPNLVEEIEAAAKAEGSEDVEKLKEENARIKGTLSEFTNALGTTEALREAGVTGSVELRKYAQDAQKLGLTDKEAIKQMVETDRSFQEQQLVKMRESIFGSDDLEVEGAGGRVPVAQLPADGGVEVLREAGIPTVDAE